jgi:lipoic acid synthetase
MTDPELKSGGVKPSWLRVRACGDGKYLEVRSLLRKYRLHTVCQEANCPNRAECFSLGTATFMIMGRYCTRNCTFCNVRHGRPDPLDGEEPGRVARAVALLDLKHAVITSVTRDDLPDGGAGQFAAVIEGIRALGGHVSIEVLTPDFRGCKRDVDTVLEARPDVFNHNVETVPALYTEVRPGADYARSLKVLENASKAGGSIVKSGIMVGLGETERELRLVFRDLRGAGVELLTIGQYLAPSKNHHPVVEYYHPSRFTDLAALAADLGFRHVCSAPLVRSSYHAGEQLSPRK